MDLNASLLGGLKWIFVTLIKHDYPSLSLPFPDHHLHHHHFLSFSLWFPNLLFLITSSSDIWFLICLILWRTDCTNILGIAPDNQIHHFLLHIFHRIMWGLMRENWFFLWLVCTFTGALRLAMRLVFLFLYFILMCKFYIAATCNCWQVLNGYNPFVVHLWHRNP